MNSQKNQPGMKSSIAQSELLIALLFLGLVSGVVIAQNATNLTNLTGDFLANLSDENFENISETDHLFQKIITIEASETIEIWANSAIEFPLERTTFYDNETLSLSVSLYLDNGSTLQDALLEFYLDDYLIGSNSTDPSGQATITLPLAGMAGEYNLSVVFEGSEFINPSQEQAEIEVRSAGNVTENITKPEIKIDKIEFPAAVNQSEEFEIKAFVTSLYRNSTNVTVELELPPEFETNEPAKLLPQINVNETITITWTVKANSCGNYTLTVSSENQNRSKDSESFEIRVRCLAFVERLLNYNQTLGNLEITMVSVGQGSYVEPGFQGKRTGYHKIYIKVFNTDEKEKEPLSVELVDDLGSRYQPDSGPLSFFLDIRKFGKDLNIYPRTIREGYLIFPEVSENTRELQLRFVLNSTKEEAAFGFERMR